MEKIEHWTKEVLDTEELWYKYEKPSVRKLAKVIGKSKSWVDKSLRLAIALRINPKLREHRTRHTAYRFALKKRKLNK